MNRQICIDSLARRLQFLVAGHCGSMNICRRQIIRRCQPKCLEIKGLVTICRSEAVSFAPYVELWCKWSLEASALKATKKVTVQKTRWLRTYDTTSRIAEIPLQTDEKPLNGQPLPHQGCSVELTKIQLAEEARQWWTLGFEAFGDLDSAPGNLQVTAQFLIAQSMPFPSFGEFINYPSWLARIKSQLSKREHG